MQLPLLFYTERSSVQDVAAHGGRCNVKCADGFTMSVIAYASAYCTPRPGWPEEWGGVDEDYAGPFTHVEVGFPSQRPEPWTEWSQYAESPEEPLDTVYPYVDVASVVALVDLHGGYA